MTGADGSVLKRLARFVQRRRQRAEAAKSRLGAHGVTFLVVSALLALINLVTSPGFLWFLFPVAGWGIGLLHHLVEARSRAQDARDAEALPPVGKDALKQAGKQFKMRRGLRHHLATTVGVTALLAGINLLLVPESGLWFVIPGAALAGSFVIHARATRARGRRLRTNLEAAESAAGTAAATGQRPADAPLLAQAEELRTAILSELRDGGEAAARWRDELQPELEAYTAHIGALLEARGDLEQAAARVSAAEVTRELEDLRGKMEESAASPELRREYEHAAAQYEGQLKSLRELQERIETIDLRAKSAVLALQRLALDLPRLRAAPAEEPAALSSLRGKSQELNRYLDDLRAGREELEAVPLPVRR